MLEDSYLCKIWYLLFDKHQSDRIKAMPLIARRQTLALEAVSEMSFAANAEDLDARRLAVFVDCEADRILVAFVECGPTTFCGKLGVG